ncbi:PREDICTED: LOW QUALITY PROTEIN: sideroflexin-2-like [Dufourea novaeangliae]|uniref:LOW QUALITY PROTEIN: sideroflexin-2-like n=1 Tax=Dufourea novaeangliae TaxID=178035 RepID=UPI000767B158|nr:PREDICTED: LOW QUALITY PROTEIN: sideroflexin-2-like [Dufourea novaeangliae]
MNSNDKIDIDQPLWDQSTYIGRWKHYAFITDCRTVIVPREKLLTAKQLCEDYRNDTVPPGTAMKDIIYAKKLKDSAFHPDNGQLMHVLGRMSFQLPSSVTITTMMLTFYKSATAIVLCQIINQTHNALLNYTNRNAMTDNDFADKNSVKTAFLCAVSASSAVVVGCEKILHQRGPYFSQFVITYLFFLFLLHFIPSLFFFQRCVPFLVVATGDVTNLPLMRQREIMMDTPLFIEDAIEPIINSKVAAVKAISECVLTRIALAVPCLLFIPMITQAIKPYCFYQRGQWMIYPIEITFA